MGTWASPDDVAQQYLRVATGHILENTGFSSTSEESLNLLSDVMRRFMRKLCENSKFYAEHAGRTLLTPDDLTLAFRRMKFSSVELHDYLSQVGNIGTCKPVARFPVSRPNPRPLFAPQPSSKELETRPDHIPHFFQAAHPEWTREGADYLAVMKPSTSTDKKSAAPDFPSFLGFTAKDLGLTRRERRATPPLLTRSDDSSATGIRSSANSAMTKPLDAPVKLNGNAAGQNPYSARKKNRIWNNLKDSSHPASPVAPSSPVSPSSFSKRVLEAKTIKPETVVSAVNVSKSADMPPKTKTPSKPKLSNQIPPLPSSDGALSPMPTLERESNGHSNILPSTDDKSRPNAPPYETAIATPPHIEDDVLAANMELFATLKEEAEKERLRKMEKEKEREERQKKKERNKSKKQEEQRRKSELRKQEAEAKENVAKLAVKTEQPAVRLEEPPASSQPQEAVLEDVNSLKIVISNPHSNNASSTFSPQAVPIPVSLPPTPSHCPESKDDEDSNTTPFFDGAQEDQPSGPTTFPLNLSLDDDTPTPHKSKKKSKKGDKERAPSSPSSKLKVKKREKEHKKKKRKREKEKEDKRDKRSEPVSPPSVSNPEEPKITLKIRLGDQTPSQAESSPVHQESSVKFKFKNLVPDNKEEKTVPPLRIGVPSQNKEPVKEPVEEPKRKFFTKAELKAPPSSFATLESPSSSKEEKRKKKEERKKREQEEKLKAEKQRAEEKQREQKKKEEKREKEVEKERSKSALSVNSSISTGGSSKQKSKKSSKPKQSLKTETVAVAVEEDDESEIWICPCCSVAWTEAATMVCCDMCDKWFHWHCVGLIVAPDDDVPWFCQKCAGKRQKKPEKRLSKTESASSNKKRRKL